MFALFFAACNAQPTPSPIPEGTLGPTERAASRTRIATLNDVQVDLKEGRERIVFKLNQLPGYHIRYVEGATHCGSGEPIRIDGGATLEIALRPATAHTESGQTTVSFTDKSFDQPLIKAVKSSCDFEANVTWLVGVASKTPYRVIEEKTPPRLIIELD